MSTAQPAPDTIEAAPNLRVVHAENRLAKLRDLSDLGMDLARTTVRKAIESAEAPASPGGEPPRNDRAEVFPKLSRDIRLTLTLEEKLENALCARLAGETPRAEKPRAGGGRANICAANDADPAGEDFYAELKTGKKARVRELMVDVIDHEIPDPHERDDSVDALEERLLCDDAYENLEDLPLRDIVERLCADLKLRPDWKRWTGEGWKPNPPFWRPRGSCFTQPSRTRILTAAPEPISRD